MSDKSLMFVTTYSSNLHQNPTITSQDCFPDDLRRLGVATWRRAGLSSSASSRFDPQTGSGPAIDQSELGALEREDMVDSQGTRWRCFSTGVPPQESRVNMSVLEPYLRVLSHGGTTRLMVDLGSSLKLTDSFKRLSYLLSTLRLLW